MSADDKASAAWDDYVSQQQQEKIEQLERELNAANDRIKRLKEVATDQRNRAEKWYIEEREDGDSVSIATTRAYFLAYTEIVREIRKAKEDKP